MKQEMNEKEKRTAKRFWLYYAAFTVIITTVLLFCLLYDFSNVPDFIYSNF